MKESIYAWKSILHGCDLLTKGMRYIVGDGSLVNMWTDSWIHDHPPRPPRARGDFQAEEKVNEYFDTIRAQGNEQKLREVIIDEDVDKILAIKISSTARQDLLGWHYKEDDIYIVKSGYWLGIHLPTNAPPIPTHGPAKLKHKIWKTKAPAKLKHFLWRFLSKSLATGNNLKRRHIVQNDQCRRCCSAAEIEDHIFFECPYAKKIWRASGVSKLTINNPNYTVEKNIEACLQCYLSIRLQHLHDLPFWLLWRLWKSKNTLIFQQKETH